MAGVCQSEGAKLARLKGNSHVQRSAGNARLEAQLAYSQVLPLMPEAGRPVGEWMRLLRPQGLGWMIDALIVATAAMKDLTILTRDLRLANMLGTRQILFFVNPGAFSQII